MERREEHRHCSIAKQTILTTHPSGLQTRVSVELANFDALCLHSECKKKQWDSPFLHRRGILGGVSGHNTPILGRRSDAVNEGRLSQQCTPVMKRREVDSPGGSPLPMRREMDEDLCEVDNSVISGWLKFRDNKRVLSALLFYANGDYQRVVGIANSLSQEAISRYIQQVTMALNHPNIIRRFIKFPNTPAAREHIKQNFYNQYGIPGVIGCIDGCHFRIFKPNKNEEHHFYCRKHYHSLNVLMWKSRWGVVTKLSPAADCLHLQLYRDPKDRYKKGQTKASLSLQHYLGFESGFTLDKESNTIAIICQDVIVVLAFETRERLIAWQVKVGSLLGSSKQFLVMIGNGGSKKLSAGPARLHLQGKRFTLTSGVPPRVLGLWELAHLRRYGVVEGRFCFEGGSHCGKGEGLHMLISDQAQDITDAFDQAAHGNIPTTNSTRASTGNGRNKSRPNTRMSDLNTQSFDQSMPDSASALYEENYFGEDCGESSSFWPSYEQRGFEQEYKANPDPPKAPWEGADHVTLERCSNCLSKLGATSRSSTVALSPETNFNPEWTMEAVPESNSDNSSNSAEYLTPRVIKKSLHTCNCQDRPPDRPPKPAQFDQKKPPAPLPQQSCNCAINEKVPVSVHNPKVGPYENYDIPKTLHAEMENAEHYDTPKKIKQALADDLFQVTNTSIPGSLVLKKQCGCILKFGSKKKPVVVECDDSLQPVECPCQKVTNWANNLIGLPYCKRSFSGDKVNTILNSDGENALYATVDVSRKTNRQSTSTDKDSSQGSYEPGTNYQNMEVSDENEYEGPYANYENLEFALSLEYYENAKDLLKKAGVTQGELDALSANIDLASQALPKKQKLCTKCDNCQSTKDRQHNSKGKCDEYLLMEPPKDTKNEHANHKMGASLGYTPMLPNPNWSQSLKQPIQKLYRIEIEKSQSIPTLNGNSTGDHGIYVSSISNRDSMQKRSSSVDSAPLLEDLKEFDSSIGSHMTSSSLETLRNLAEENRLSSPCDNDRECYDCCKSSGSENKTSDDSYTKDVPHLRNKHMDNAQIKRSSSVPCKSGNRDSSSSNDSGVSSCSMKHGNDFQEFEMPLTSCQTRHHYTIQKRLRGSLSSCVHSSLPRKSKSSDPLRDMSMQIHKANIRAKSSSAEAEVPVLPPKQFKGVMDTHSTSSGTSDMSDYIETLSLTSSQSSSDTQSGVRINRQPTSTLRPRSGKEYHNLDPIITSMYKNGKEMANYTNLS